MCIVKEAKAFSKIVNLIQGVPKKNALIKQTKMSKHGLSTFKSGPKGSEMVNINDFDNL